jgi:hypothetical protein
MRGEDQGQAKLSENDVVEIRARYAAGARQIDLAAQFNIGQTTISKIVLRKAWQHV